jgi:hypothetical protein
VAHIPDDRIGVRPLEHLRSLRLTDQHVTAHISGCCDVAVGPEVAAGFLDEIVVSIVPILLGGGARLVDNIGDATLEQVESLETPGVTHIRYARP